VSSEPVSHSASPTASAFSATIVPRSHACAPLSYGQESLWLLDQLTAGLSVDNRPIAFSLEGPLDRSALEGALDAVVQRHEVLRSRFRSEAGGPRVVIAEEPGGFAFEDLADLPPEEREREARARADAEVARPLDLAAGPLVRTRLIRLGPESHWLVATLHHIVSDGFSDAIFWREAAAAYSALARHQQPSLPKLPLQYGDFAAWQREHLQDPRLAAELEFWRASLGAGAAVLDLPVDRPRGPTQSLTGAEVRLSLPAPLTTALERLARSRGSTLFMAVLAGFAALLYRYTEEALPVIGCAVVGRPQRALEALVGPFADLLALRLDASGDPGFATLLQRTRRTVLDALSRPDMPMGLLVEALRARSGLPRPSLFQVALNWRGFEEPAFTPRGLLVTRLAQPRRHSRLDLTLEGRRSQAGIELLAEYSTALFDRTTIERLLGHLATLLAHAAEAPDTPVSALRLMSEPERRHLASGFQGERRDFDASAGIHGSFLAQALHRPDAIAARCGETSLSYGELEVWSRRISSQVSALGLAPGARIGLLVERSLAMLAGLLGVLRSGNAWVPLDPAFPEERLRFLLDDAGLSAILTEAAVAARVPTGSKPAITIEAAGSMVAVPVETAGPGGSWATAVAHVIYTSGSTGRPKGVVIPHRGVVNFLEDMRERLRVTASDVFGAATTLSFDPALLELLLPLACGASLEIVSRETTHDGAALARRLVESRVTIFQGTPASYRLLLEAGWRGGPRMKLLCGGEPLAPDLAERLRGCAAELWNVYGPTETTVWCTAERYRGGRVSVGRPIANTRVYVLDPRGQPVPIGVTGELCIGGAGLGLGYHGRPDLTAEHFVPDPLAPSAGEKRYRTGDLGRFWADGRIEVHGRLDHQAKLRGVRIEPGEIEAALRRTGRVADAAVSVEGAGSEARLVAFVVPRRENVVDAASLRRELARVLPDFMVPTAIDAVSALPLTPNGKLDRGRLPRCAAPVLRQHVPPRDPLEAMLAGLFEEVLERERVGVLDDFFDLGGHSLRAARLFHGIRSRLGVALPLGTILEAPSVASLASLLRSEARSARPSLVELRAGGAAAPLFFVHGMGGGVVAYRPLAETLSPGQGAYGLQAPWADETAPPLEAMAAAYVREIRAVQPRGPYRLAGLSFGGIVCFEMAQQLVAAGERVSFLALLDTWGPGYPRFRWSVPRVAAHLRNLARLPWRERWEYLEVRLSGVGLLLRRGPTRAIRRVARRLGLAAPRVLRAWEGSYLWAAREYRERSRPSYPGRVLLFRARQQPVGSLPEPTNGWGALALQLEVLDVDGSHGTLLDPERVRAWAPQFRRLLEES